MTVVAGEGGRRPTAKIAVGLQTVTGATTRTLRNVRDVVIATAQQLPRRRIVALAVAVVMLVAIALLVPMPTAVELRDWSRSVGAWLPLAFLAAHTAVTVFPFPRTAFTLAAGLLFGTWYGVLIAVIASTTSAVIALLLVRTCGWHMSRLVSHPAIESADTRLRQRGWQAVLSLRLIPAVPFAVINYAAGASSVRLLPYTLATLIGLVPGTTAVVVLGDAFTGNVSPMLALVSVCTAAVGIAGLIYEIRKHRREHHAVT